MGSKKLGVLIVDDEFRIGMLIKKLIRWDEIGLECIDVVCDGKTAYEIILNQHPDIVITDIRMPKISGLDLIRMAKDQAKFVVISGYTEFEYAHKALQYGVKDYLLKPINEEELNKVLKKIHEECSKTRAKQIEEEQLQETIKASEYIIKSKLLNNIIEQTERHPSEVEIRQDYYLKIDAAAYRGIDIKLDYREYEKIDKRQDRITVEKAIAIIENNFKENAKEHLICEKDYLHIYCLISYDLPHSKDIKNKINSLLSELKEYLLGFEQYEVTIGIGSEKTEFNNIGFSIQEAYRAVQNRIKVGTGRLIYAESLQFEKEFDVQEYLDQHKDMLLKSIESLSKDSFEQSIGQIYSKFHVKEDVDFSGCYDIAYELIHIFFDNLKIRNKEGELLKEFLLNSYQHCYTLDKLKHLLSGHLSEYLDVCLKAMETELSKPIRQAVQYIEQHYSEKIVLEDIANIVGLNPVYFSVLFKNETGLNFSVYLIDIRMKIAKKLLCDTKKTIYAVADEVGYKDTRYFSKIFTKTIGVKPSLYRKLYS